MKEVHKFIKGLVQDIDVSMHQPTQWTFPALNIQIFNKDGQGLIVTNLDGNQLDAVNGIGFNIKTDYIVIGATELNGIAYIVSCHKDAGVVGDINFGRGEIGCFPSPQIYNATNTTFIREYKPLNNFFDPARQALNTTRFLFDPLHMIEVFTKPSYDDSVDLYICDHNVTNKVINTGFKETGEQTEREINPDDFDGKLNHVPSTQSPMNVFLTSIDNGGVHRPGMYYFFFRYLTADYNRTSFVSQLGPVQLFDGDDAVSLDGMQEKDWINNVLRYTNKQVKITLTNIDPTYTYLEIGVIRYTSDTENGIAIKDTYLIDTYYNVVSVIANAGNITLKGNENQSTLTFEEIQQSTIDFSICKSHLGLNNRYKGTNWKRVSYDAEKLAEYAQLITISYNATKTIDDKTFNDLEAGIGGLYQYKDYDDVVDYVGYFDGEIYPYGVVYLLNDGTKTEAFPLTGSDEYAISTNINPNTKGLYRFPMKSDLFPAVHPVNFKDTVLGVMFDNNVPGSSSIALYNANPEAFANVIGFYYVRGERIKNFICQGFMMQAYNGFQYCPTSTTTFFFGTNVEATASKIPLYKGRLPFVFQQAGTGNYYYQHGDPTPGSTHLSLAASWKYGIYCPDHIMGNVDIPSTAYIRPVYSFGNLAAGEISLSGLHSYDVVLDLEVGVNYTPLADIYTLVNTNNIPTAKNRGSGGFSSYYTDASVDVSQSAFYSASVGCTTSRVWNRSMISLPYIGIDDDTGALAGFEHTLVNIYQQVNNVAYYNSTVSGFNVVNEVYTKISRMNALNADTGPVTYYKGDCLLQKTFNRVMRFFGADDSGFFHDFVGTSYMHALLLGMLTKNTFNTAMRNEVDTEVSGAVLKYSYYPKCKDSGFSALAWVADGLTDVFLYEALQINDGYNQLRSGIFDLGVNILKPESSLDRPNRVYHSDAHVAGSYVDGYRTIQVASFQDFHVEDGPITAIKAVSSFLMIIQRDKIYQLYYDERAIKATDGTSDIILGVSARYLERYSKNIANFGSEHQWSIINIESGIVGVSWKRRLIWMISQKSTAESKAYVGAVNLTAALLIEKWIFDLVDTQSDFSDVINVLVDNPVQGQGIITGYDRRNNMVYFTFLLPLFPADIEVRSVNKTIAFNEKTGYFVDEVSFKPMFYLSINNDFYTVKPIELPANDYMISSNEIYLHNRKDLPQTFYGTVYPMRVSFIVNGIAAFSEKGKGDMSAIIKMFTHMTIEMNEVKLKTITYTTSYQTSVYDFATTKIEEKPEYDENKWKFPITLQTSATSNDYQFGSNMRGEWLKVTLEYYPSSAAENIYIRNVITDFLESKI